MLATSVLEIVLVSALALTFLLLHQRAPGAFYSKAEARIAIDELEDLIRHHQIISIISNSKQTLKFERNKVVSNKTTAYTLKRKFSFFEARFGNLSNPSKLVMRPDGSVSPGRVGIKSHNFQCSLIISIRGALRKNC